MYIVVVFVQYECTCINTFSTKLVLIAELLPFRERAAHSDNRLFPLYHYYFFFQRGFWVFKFALLVPVFGLCIVTLSLNCNKWYKMVIFSIKTLLDSLNIFLVPDKLLTSYELSG